MKRTIKLTDNYIHIPIQLGNEEHYLEIFKGDEKIFEFLVPAGKENAGYAYDYVASINANQYKGESLSFEGDFEWSFFDLIEEGPKEKSDHEPRPLFHFTPKYGWINDPNGLVFDGEKYHLYFQHNPCNIKWNNMSWGHATSSDLINWTQHDDVMFPDENGTMFSGCGLNYDGRLYFPYTVAGTSTKWNDGKPFYQGLAISNDGGMTLEKQKEPFLGVVGKDSRDPKVFWHEESQSYIMVLYLENCDFAIYRSKDLKDWQESQCFDLEKDHGWECPDLIKVPCVDGGYKWMFWCADGYYYWGDFDGYKFQSDFKLHHAYFNKNLYATQSYSGIMDRVVAIPWLRFEERNGKNYQGAMGVPREYSCKKQGDDYVLIQTPVKEFREQYASKTLHLESNQEVDLCLTIEDNLVEILFSEGEIHVGKNVDKIPEFTGNIEFIVDHNILEITFGQSVVGAYLIES